MKMEHIGWEERNNDGLRGNLKKRVVTSILLFFNLCDNFFDR